MLECGRMSLTTADHSLLCLVGGRLEPYHRRATLDANGRDALRCDGAHKHRRRDPSATSLDNFGGLADGGQWPCVVIAIPAVHF